MKHPNDTRFTQERFAELVQNFDSKEHAKEHPLEPFVGASYKLVNSMLSEVGVERYVSPPWLAFVRLDYSILLVKKRNLDALRRLRKTPQNTQKSIGETFRNF